MPNTVYSEKTYLQKAGGLFILPMAFLCSYTGKKRYCRSRAVNCGHIQMMNTGFLFIKTIEHELS